MKKKSNENKEMRKFKTGATRDTDCGKLDYEGFLSPLVLERYAKYMNTHRIQADGQVRSSDNWQKGIPEDVYMKSMWRHFMDVWKAHRDCEPNEEALCAMMFNVMGMLHEQLSFSNKFERSLDEFKETQAEGDEEVTHTAETWITIDDVMKEKSAKSNLVGLAFSLAIGAIGIGCLGFGLFYLITGALA
jgi:hypothetical protein